MPHRKTQDQHEGYELPFVTAWTGGTPLALPDATGAVQNPAAEFSPRPHYARSRSSNNTNANKIPIALYSMQYKRFNATYVHGMAAPVATADDTLKKLNAGSTTDTS